ncbi:MAG: hypothetical protein AAGJ55_07130 [Cyanobacteria bacterium J06555_12]
MTEAISIRHPPISNLRISISTDVSGFAAYAAIEGYGVGDTLLSSHMN